MTVYFYINNILVINMYMKCVCVRMYVLYVCNNILIFVLVVFLYV